MHWLVVALMPFVAVASPVMVYSDALYKGDSLALDVTRDITALPAKWSQTISSLKITPGYEFIGYRSPFIVGDPMPFIIWDLEAIGFVQRSWNDQIVSYEVRVKSTSNQKSLAYLLAIIVYTEPEFMGSSMFMGLGTVQLNQIRYLNRNISSIAVSPGYQLVVKDDTGAAKTYYDDARSLEAWDDKSVTITCSKMGDASGAATLPVTMAPLPTTLTPVPTTTAIPTISASESPTNYTGVIIGTAVGAVVAVALIGWFVLKRKRHQSGDYNVYQPYVDSNTATHSNNLALLDLSVLYKIRLDSGALRLDTIVGRGSFAEVWKGTYDGTTVAVKRLQNGRHSNCEIQAFINEMQLMAGFDSPNIIKLVGAVWTSPLDLRCVMEFMDLGDLKDHLATHDATVLLWRQKLHILRGIVNGLAYLHSLNIVHRDLKSRNVLLDSKKGVKLVDFGVAKEDVQGTMTLGVGTFRWMAPEVLHESAYTVAADIYSFGMLLSEMDTHHIPYEDMKNPKTGQPLADPAIISAVMNGTMKPTFTATCPAWLKELADACLQYDPSNRPTVYDIAAILAKIDIA
ncbi:protein kinase [Achlya hypogyna]|uniref:Protein kinase n=1 Tax=Achlya hypogyna TaxID=1202772 RepID=A0A1V9YSI1_ACHHY|nr:protein kinase [Achlya hypogyna]